jgi:DNA-binding transcriptional ArsR family regulator
MQDNGMTDGIRISEVAALVGHPARANILCTLLDGRALTATELASAARLTAQTTSEHLAKLVTAQLLVPRKEGRHRYFRIAGKPVSLMLESIMNVAELGPSRYQPRANGDEHHRRARLCYDHLAGQLGVGLTASLVGRGLVILGDEAGEVSTAGEKVLAELGVDFSSLNTQRRVFCRPCLDWTERHYHIGGALGAAIANRFFDLKWIERHPHSRALTITEVGLEGLRGQFDCDLGTPTTAHNANA